MTTLSQVSSLVFLLIVSLVLGCSDETGSQTHTPGGNDSGTLDADAESDGGALTSDVGSTDVGASDVGTVSADSGTDTGTPDTGTPDTGTPDTGTPDDSGTSVELADPSVAGPFAVERTSHTINSIEVELHMPAGAGPFSGIVFGPGFQLGAANFRATGQHLASHGIATLIPTFGDGFLSPITHSDLATLYSAMLDFLAADGRVDADSLGTAGHSRGGKVAILTAIRDRRVKATFTLDPVDSAGGPGTQPSVDNPSVTPELMDQFLIPGGFVGTGKGGEVRFSGQACAPEAENYEQYIAHAASDTIYEFLLPDAGHNDFAEDLSILLRAACTAGDDPAATRRFAHTRMTAFFRIYLDGEEGYRSALTAP